MAYIFNNKEDDELQSGAPSSQPIRPAPAITAGPGGGGGAASVPGGETPASNGSGQFANFDRILGLNQGLATGLANNLAGTVGGEAQHATDDANGAVSGYENYVGQHTVPGQISQYHGADPTEQYDDQVLTPGHYTGTYDNFGDYVNGTATPGGLYAPPPLSDQTTPGSPPRPNMNQIQNEFTTAGDDVGSLQSNAGIQSKLQTQFAGPGYTQGMSNMDAALTNAAGQDQFSKLNTQFGSMDFGKDVQDANDFYSKAQSQNATLDGILQGKVNQHNLDAVKGAVPGAIGSQVGSPDQPSGNYHLGDTFPDGGVSAPPPKPADGQNWHFVYNSPDSKAPGHWVLADDKSGQGYHPGDIISVSPGSFTPAPPGYQWEYFGHSGGPLGPQFARLVPKK